MPRVTFLGEATRTACEHRTAWSRSIGPGKGGRRGTCSHSAEGSASPGGTAWRESEFAAAGLGTSASPDLAVAFPVVAFPADEEYTMETVHI